jgi:hypothetical protein
LHSPGLQCSAHRRRLTKPRTRAQQPRFRATCVSSSTRACRAGLLMSMVATADAPRPGMPAHRRYPDCKSQVAAGAAYCPNCGARRRNLDLASQQSATMGCLVDALTGTRVFSFQLARPDAEAALSWPRRRQRRSVVGARRNSRCSIVCVSVRGAVVSGMPRNGRIYSPRWERLDSRD